MQRAVDSNNITLCQHVLQVLDTTATDLLLDFRLEWLVIIVQQLLAVEGLQSTEHTLANTSHSYGADNLVLEVVLVLRGRSDVPFTGLDLLVGGDEVADKHEDGHEHMLGNGDDIGAGHFGDGDAAVGLVGGVEVDVVGANAGGDGDLEFLRLGQSLGGEVTRVEAVGGSSVRCAWRSEADVRLGLKH
jgi:hypothetical protein